ncbi:c-type cytochrome biogenesis protein CcsB [Mycetocola tolaasinivorans]|uniref:C-type cytochrome biogenesis protein CcsB n=1 Tax=Mycetocola tolaasinivorans TaxID=76635 RepID=A0A3L7A703_9MICO|nr:c-type cytochrome biogenesis protein CcsB [Mycetocola tolaasinivorans]RLP75668.1 c-type cytochrome biogenesis protein CcsB [Mycetocola tolaasinivorans]
MTLDLFSVWALWSAIALYAISFVAFSFDLARRSAEVTAAADRAAEEASAQAAGSEGGMLANAAAGSRGGRAAGGTLTLEENHAGSVTASRSISLRIGVSLAVLGFLVHLAAVITRGVAAERVPWANMYEFAMTGTAVIVAVFLIALTRVDLRFLGAFIMGLIVILLGLASLNFYIEVAPLPPALQSAWLVIHVFVATTGTGFFFLGFALTALQLIQARREAAGTALTAKRFRFMATLPSSQRLDNLSYRVNIIGFILWTFTLIAGAIWAEAAWGRYWGWDVKEVWTFIIWVIYAGYIHARATRGWRGNRAAWLSMIGAATVLFNFTVVNLFFKGLHAYSGL